jgi:hypothetical protein
MKFLWKSPQFVSHATIAALCVQKTPFLPMEKNTISINGAAQYVASAWKFAPSTA